jgi:hypothetical protein
VISKVGIGADQVLILVLELYQHLILTLYNISLRKEGDEEPGAGLISAFISPDDESLTLSFDVSLIFVVVLSMESS